MAITRQHLNLPHPLTGDQAATIRCRLWQVSGIEDIQITGERTQIEIAYERAEVTAEQVAQYLTRISAAFGDPADGQLRDALPDSTKEPHLGTSS